MKSNKFQYAFKKLIDLVNISQYHEAKTLAYELLENQELLEDNESSGKIYNVLGLVYQNLSDYPNALKYYFISLDIFEQSDNKLGISANLGNIGIIYTFLSDYTKALVYYEKSLDIYEELENKIGIANNLGNIGNVHNLLSNHSSAIEYFLKAFTINEELGNIDGIAANLGNIGLVYSNSHDYIKALEYYKKALTLYEQIAKKVGIANNLVNIGDIYATKESTLYDCNVANEYLQQSLFISEEIGAKEIEKEAYEKLHKLRLNERQFEEALKFQTKAISIEKEILSIEAKKQAERFDIERSNAEREKKLAVERAEAQTVKRILHNILPVNIAKRILNQETFIADYFQSVSVLFLDLVGFTVLATLAPPKQLVYLLDTIFTKADEVVESFGLEKIKTIGDGYMAVANVTTPLENHQIATALAALQLLETMKDFTVNIPSELGDTDWINNMNDIEIRIGIHTGEVVAGIIGKNKYTYDLWGDAVNVASRMESNSEPGRIHVSDEFAKSIENNAEFSLIPRGEILIKGKGTMKTYWLEKAR